MSEIEWIQCTVICLWSSTWLNPTVNVKKCSNHFDYRHFSDQPQERYRILGIKPIESWTLM